MEAWKLLLGSDIGLLSLFTIGFVIAMGAWMINFYKKQIEKDARKAE